jgi:TrmH family RNA methyltransferase
MRIEDVVVVLVRPKVPGNIGSAARGMKVMGLKELRLVAPQADHLAKETRWMAYASEDVLEAARVFDDLASALADCNVRVATTHRMGRRREVDRTLAEYAAEAAALPDGTRIALVFGPEEFGLTNDELAACDFALTIPQAIEYPSLNLGQAVVVACAALFGAVAAATTADDEHLASVEEMEQLYGRIGSALRVLGYRDVPDRNLYAAAMRTLRRAFGRAGLRASEARSLHGIFRRVELLAERAGGQEDDENRADTSV